MTSVRQAGSSGRERSGFHLTGPSTALDPRLHAVRPDLADLRLAGRVFASHYAAPVACRVRRETEVTSARDRGEVVASLATGDGFEMLDLSGGIAWGRATGSGLVGYVDAAALEQVDAGEAG